jgi:hypothetical protein
MREVSGETLGRGQRFSLGGAVLLAAGLAAYGAMGSYTTVSALARCFHRVSVCVGCRARRKVL